MSSTDIPDQQRDSSQDAPDSSGNHSKVTTMVTTLVDELVAALVNARIYWSDHPRVQASVTRVQELLSELGELLGLESISIAVSKEYLVFQRRPLLGASLAASRLIKPVLDWKAGGIEMSTSTTTRNLCSLFDVLMSSPTAADSHDTANLRLSEQGCEQVHLLPPYTGRDSEADDNQDRMFLPVQLYKAAIELLQDVTVSVCTGGRIQFDEVREHAVRMIKALDESESPMMSLAREEQYDAFTFGHSVRVSVLALNFGRALTSDKDVLIRIGTAALLHDVGKSQIPFEILHSNKPLTDEERDEINRHPICGAQILLDHDESDDVSISAAFGHHRMHTAGGYPKTIHEHQQSMITRIVKICDVYEALTAARPYKRPMTPIRAYRIMLGMDGHFDPRLLRRFIEVNGIFPDGQLVELNTGEWARVQQQGSKLLLPTVEVLVGLDGEPLSDEDKRIIELSDPSMGCQFCVRAALDEDLVEDKLNAVPVVEEPEDGATAKAQGQAPNGEARDGDDDEERLPDPIDDPTYC